MLIDRCQFLSSEDGENVANRTTIAINAHANDVKICNNRVARFRHFAILGGAAHCLWAITFSKVTRLPAVFEPQVWSLLKRTPVQLSLATISITVRLNGAMNTIPRQSSVQFSALSVNDNVFLSGDVAPWFSYVVVKPHGVGHFLKDVSISGNRFKFLGLAIDRAERVDTSFADLDYSRMREINFADNSFHGVNERVSNPLRFKYTEGSAATTWTIDTADQLPFKGQALAMDSVVVVGRIRNSSNSVVFPTPYVDLR